MTTLRSSSSATRASSNSVSGDAGGSAAEERPAALMRRLRWATNCSRLPSSAVRLTQIGKNSAGARLSSHPVTRVVLPNPCIARTTVTGASSFSDAYNRGRTRRLAGRRGRLLPRRARPNCARSPVTNALSLLPRYGIDPCRANPRIMSSAAYILLSKPSIRVRGNSPLICQ